MGILPLIIAGGVERARTGRLEIEIYTRKQNEGKETRLIILECSVSPAIGGSKVSSI